MVGDTSEGLSLAGEAYVIVRERILRGELGIGQTISRRKLAAELGMSFLPVSEALIRLELEGLLESRPRAGTRVRIPTRQDVCGHYVVREALEVQSARLFTEVATAEERAELEKLAARVDAMATQAEASRFVYLTLHERLHRRIAECARCPALCEAIEKTHALASSWRCGPRPPASPSDSPRRTHQDLVRVLAGGDPEAAGEAMRRHIAGSMQRTLERLEPYFKMRKKSGKTYLRSSKKKLAAEVAAPGAD